MKEKGCRIAVASGIGGRGEGDPIPSASHVLSGIHWSHAPWHRCPTCVWTCRDDVLFLSQPKIYYIYIIYIINNITITGCSWLYQGFSNRAICSVLGFDCRTISGCPVTLFDQPISWVSDVFFVLKSGHWILLLECLEGVSLVLLMLFLACSGCNMMLCIFAPTSVATSWQLRLRCGLEG